jgi:tRNA (guanine26-N2/guanine27-N2)-dimethyltransferase
MLSVSVDFYVRVFVRIYTSPSACKHSPTKLSHVYQCVGCESFHLQPLARTTPTNDGNATRFMPGLAPCVSPKCEECGWDFNMGGPFWTEPLHDAVWTKKLLAKLEREKALFSAYGKVHALLTTVNEELLDVPLFMSIHAMSHTLKCTPPPANLFRSALINAGYRASTAHCNPLALKTDAPMSVLWDIMRCWVQEHPVKPSKEKTPAVVILAKEPKLKANFSRVAGAMIKSQQQGVPRFPQNPEENWGPKPRAGTAIKRPAPDDATEDAPTSKAAKADN